jgi:hypothetical protein
MIYIQIPKEDNAIGFLALARSGTSVCACPKTPMASHPNTWYCLDESVLLSRDWKATRFVYRNPHDLTMTKYEIYLPLKYNDGTGIEPEKLEEIQQQLIAVFGAMTVSFTVCSISRHMDLWWCRVC